MSGPALKHVAEWLAVHPEHGLSLPAIGLAYIYAAKAYEKYGHTTLCSDAGLADELKVKRATLRDQRLALTQAGLIDSTTQNGHRTMLVSFPGLDANLPADRQVGMRETNRTPHRNTTKPAGAPAAPAGQPAGSTGATCRTRISKVRPLRTPKGKVLRKDGGAQAAPPAAPLRSASLTAPLRSAASPQAKPTANGQVDRNGHQTGKNGVPFDSAEAMPAPSAPGRGPDKPEKPRCSICGAPCAPAVETSLAEHLARDHGLTHSPRAELDRLVVVRDRYPDAGYVVAILKPINPDWAWPVLLNQDRKPVPLFRCPHCTSVDIDEDLVNDHIRDHARQPVLASPPANDLDHLPF